MLQLLIGIGIVLAVVVLTELISRKKVIDEELTRKVPHLIAGIVIASLPFFIEFKFISYGAIADIILVLLIYKFNWFSRARHVARRTYGELFFPLGVLAASLITQNKWVFAASILTLGIADSMAALVGTKRGKHIFHVLGQKKSIEGSAAFAVVALTITAWVVYIAPAGIMNSWQILLCLPLLSAFVEAYSPFGTDNFFVPVTVAAVLNALVVVS